MAFCIPKEKIQALKKLVNNIDGKTGADKLEKLTNMSKEEKIKFFSKAMPEYQAKKLADEYEKAVISKRTDALSQWIRKNLDEKYRQDEIKALNDKKFKSVKELETYVETRADVLANKKHGVALTNDEVRKFTELGTALYKKGAELGDDFGDVLNNQKGMYEFGKIHKELNDFTEDLLPSNLWERMLKTWGRASMLASPKTAFINIESNAINAMTEGFTRRAVNKTAKHSLDKTIKFPVYKAVKGKLVKTGENDIIKAYKKNAYALYKTTGIDVSRMISIDDTVAGSGKILGEKSLKAKNKVAIAYTDFVFEKMLTEPDVRFSNFAYADSAGLMASKFAKGDIQKANEFFQDSLRIGGNLTDEGKIIREQSIADARRATYTNNTGSAKFANATRDLLNSIPYLRVGDLTMPFVKTVANVAELGLDYSGLGLVKHGKTGYKLAMYKTGKVARPDREAMRSFGADAVRAGIGLTTAYAIASSISSKDFVGAYDPERVGIDQLANTSYNAIKVGKYWVSIDYFGPISIPLVGMLYSFKYGSESGYVTSYMYGAGSAYLNQMPMTDPILTTVDNFKKSLQDKEGLTKVFGDTISRTATDILASRMIPGIIPDIAKSIDEYQRDTRDEYIKMQIGDMALKLNYGKVLQKLPVARQTLPVKYNAFGKDLIETQSLLDLFGKFAFGARVKQDMSDEVVDEVFRLRDEGTKPNVRDLRFMRSNTNAGKLRKKVGTEKFNEIAKQYGQDLHKAYSEVMKSDDYKNADNVEKKKLLNEQTDKIYNNLMEQYKIGKKYE